MKNNLLKILIIIFFINILLIFPLMGMQHLRTDNSEIKLRQIPSSSIAAYSHQKAFQYNEVQPAESFFAKFWRWFWQRYENVNNNQAGHLVLEILVYAIAAAVLIFGILKFAGMDKLVLFSPKKTAASNIQFQEWEENIHELDFDREIEKAIEQKAFRLAIRLLYLKTLRRLSEMDLIKWEKNKTNAAYCSELSSAELKPSFRRITRSFEYIWYGEFLLSEAEYQSVAAEISSFQQQISKDR